MVVVSNCCCSLPPARRRAPARAAYTATTTPLPAPAALGITRRGTQMRRRAPTAPWPTAREWQRARMPRQGAAGSSRAGLPRLSVHQLHRGQLLVSGGGNGASRVGQTAGLPGGRACANRATAGARPRACSGTTQRLASAHDVWSCRPLHISAATATAPTPLPAPPAPTATPTTKPLAAARPAR